MEQVAGYLGVDTGKTELVLEILSFDDSFKPRRRTVPNNHLGFIEAEKWFRSFGFGKSFVCMEATGNYSVGFAEFMFAQKHVVFVVNPRLIKRYAEAIGLLGKSDRIDAHAIAHYALTTHREMKPWSPRSDVQKELRNVRAYLVGLNKERTASLNRLQDNQSSFVIERLEKHIAHLDQEIRETGEYISKLIESDSQLCEQKQLLLSIIGIGPIVSNALLTYIDFSAFENGRQLKRFVGIIPKRAQSGTCLNTRGHLSREGNSEVRGLLWNSARTAIAHDPRMRAYAERLRLAGKGPDAIKVAVAAKILNIAHAVVRNKKPYDLNYQNPMLLGKPTPQAISA